MQSAWGGAGVGPLHMLKICFIQVTNTARPVRSFRWLFPSAPNRIRQRTPHRFSWHAQHCAVHDELGPGSRCWFANEDASVAPYMKIRAFSYGASLNRAHLQFSPFKNENGVYFRSAGGKARVSSTSERYPAPQAPARGWGERRR